MLNGERIEWRLMPLGPAQVSDWKFAVNISSPFHYLPQLRYNSATCFFGRLLSIGDSQTTLNSYRRKEKAVAIASYLGRLSHGYLKMYRTWATGPSYPRAPSEFVGTYGNNLLT